MFVTSVGHTSSIVANIGLLRLTNYYVVGLYCIKIGEDYYRSLVVLVPIIIDNDYIQMWLIMTKLASDGPSMG